MATQVMAVELAADGVRANSIGPGYTDTPLFRGAREEGDEAIAPLLDRVPAGRLGSADEIARRGGLPGFGRVKLRHPATASSPTAAGWSTAIGSAPPRRAAG